jgi:hypothetical protein
MTDDARLVMVPNKTKVIAERDGRRTFALEFIGIQALSILTL